VERVPDQFRSLFICGPNREEDVGLEDL
jgi:hypothetical protein